jgi:hypothetical protein
MSFGRVSSCKISGRKARRRKASSFIGTREHRHHHRININVDVNVDAKWVRQGFIRRDVGKYCDQLSMKHLRMDIKTDDDISLSLVVSSLLIHSRSNPKIM